MILYIETNFLMSYATGRNLGSDRILSDRPTTTDLVVPSVCFMEAFSVLEDEKKRHNRFINDLRSQITQSRRNLISSRVEYLIDHLDQAIVEIKDVFNDFQSRLMDAIKTLSSTAELIDPTPEIMRKSFATELISDPTDNLILASILQHASLNNRQLKVFLSENYRDFGRNSIPEAAFQEVGIKYFADASKCLEWHQALLE